MTKGSSFRSLAVLAVAATAVACDRAEPVAVQEDARDVLTTESPAEAMHNPRQMEGPVWEAVLTPLNAHAGSRAVTGKAVLTMDGEGTLSVSMDVRGVDAGQLHAQHIHGHGGEATCPTPQADADGDGLVSVGEGVPDYGGVLVPLMPFPTPDGNRYHYEQMFEGQGDLDPASRAIVVHGAFVEGEYVVSLPVACGTIDRVR